MDFARTMIKLFANKDIPNGVYFKYGRRLYKIHMVTNLRIHYHTDTGTPASLEVARNTAYSIRSVITEGSRLIKNSSKTIIDIGGAA
jgi:hypothetical protein